jgi:hypothetical protein
MAFGAFHGSRPRGFFFAKSIVAQQGNPHPLCPGNLEVNEKKMAKF